MHDDDEYEVETEFEDDGEPDYVHLASRTPRKNNKWIVITGVLELVEHFCVDLALFFETMKLGSLQRYQWQNDRQAFFEETSQEFETLAITEVEEE